MAVITRSRARQLPAIAGEALVGIVRMGDVVKGQLPDLDLEVCALGDYARMRT